MLTHLVYDVQALCPVEVEHTVEGGRVTVKVVFIVLNKDDN